MVGHRTGKVVHNVGGVGHVISVVKVLRNPYLSPSQDLMGR